MVPKYELDPWRKFLYYGGMVVTGIGILLFLSVFVTGFLDVGRSMGPMGSFGAFQRSGQSMFGRAFLGVVLSAVGQVMRAIGAKGLAGSGVVLDPQQARRDIEPWSRAAGGALSDALSEVEIRKSGKQSEARTVVKVRCRECGALNDESNQFCGRCGKQL